MNQTLQKQRCTLISVRLCNYRNVIAETKRWSLTQQNTTVNTKPYQCLKVDSKLFLQSSTEKRSYCVH